jgi:hypothetical protein
MTRPWPGAQIQFERMFGKLSEGVERHLAGMEIGARRC